MTTWPILSVVTFLPLFGALVIYLNRGDDEAGARDPLKRFCIKTNGARCRAKQVQADL